MMENLFIFKRPSPLKVSVNLILIIRGKPAIPSCQSSHLLEDSAHHLSLQLNLCCQEQLVAFEGRDKKEPPKTPKRQTLQMLHCSSGRIHKIHKKDDVISRGLLWL